MTEVFAFIAGVAVGVGIWDRFTHRRLGRYQDEAIKAQKHAIAAGKEFKALCERSLL